MTNTLELELAIKRAMVTKKEIAIALNISSMSLYKKINNITEFKASELYKLTDVLNLGIKERELIFFTHNGDLKSTNTA